MAEVWAAAIGAAVIGAAATTNAANKAASAQKRAANQAIAHTEQNYDRTKSDLQPYITLGGNAVGTLNALNSGDYSAFHADPGYKFAFDQGLQALDRSAAARGSLMSGGHSADLIKFGQGLADQQYGQFFNRLMGLAGMGQNAASNLGSVGNGAAASIGANLTNAGNAEAQGYINSANAFNSGLGQIAGAYAQYRGGYIPPVTTSSYSTPSYTSSSLNSTAPQVSVGDIPQTIGGPYYS